jgi:hypothetical protein
MNRHFALRCEEIDWTRRLGGYGGCCLRVYECLDGLLKLRETPVSGFTLCLVSVRVLLTPGLFLTLIMETSLFALHLTGLSASLCLFRVFTALTAHLVSDGVHLRGHLGRGNLSLRLTESLELPNAIVQLAVVARDVGDSHACGLEVRANTTERTLERLTHSLRQEIRQKGEPSRGNDWGLAWHNSRGHHWG